MARTHIMRTIRRTRGFPANDEGISIIEVLAATLIFLIISVGVAQATVTAIRLAGDQRHRVTALSLAAGEIDLVRAIADPFEVLDRDLVHEVDGMSYTIHRETSWVSSTGLDIPCGEGGTGTLQYKRINVRVTWEGQIAPISPVSSDTILAPQGRLNDPTRGTILIAATRADGTGASGVTATVTPVGSGAVALDAAPAATNGEGCTYALQVVPGVYTVTLSRSGYIAADQQASPSNSVTVTAGATVTVPFTYDQAASFTMNYAAGSTAHKATNFATTFVSTYGVYTFTGSSSPVQRFPWSSGYRAIAGHYVAPDASGSGGCRALDPAEWEETTTLAAGSAATPVAAVPGGTATMDVGLGIVRFASIPQNYYLKAVSQDVSAVEGQPGCSVGTSYEFGRVSNSSSSAAREIMLPYGTWRIFSSTSSAAAASAAVSVTITAPSNAVSTGMVSGNQVTLDPRVLK